MTELQHDLPEGTVPWVEATGGGRVTRLERHVARREAWIVDVTRPDGSVLEGFLRLEREQPSAETATSLFKETKIIEALGRTSVPVPKVFGRSEELGCTLFERVRGRADIDKLTDARQQRAVMEDFIRVMARMHALDLDELALAPYMPYLPTTAEEAALEEVDLALRQWKDFLAGYTEPLITFGVDWLRRNAPKTVARISLVQGDTGPVNFMFDGDEVTAVIDLEWGHYGDPLEDLGNFCVREFWNPSGGLRGLFELYEKESGIPYTREAAMYYRVHQNVRGMIPIHAVTVMAHPRESVAWFLAYRYIGDRATCEAIAEAEGVQVERPEMPTDAGTRDILSEAAQYAIDNDVQPHLSNLFARSRANDVKILVQVMDRKRRYGATLASTECDELGELLGTRPATLDEGLRALDEAIRERRLPDDQVISYLTRRSYRDEWLYAPAVSLYPERRWSPLD